MHISIISVAVKKNKKQTNIAQLVLRTNEISLNLCLKCGVIWMLDNWRKFSEKLRKLIMYFSADGSSSILLFDRGNPAGHNVMGIHL